MEFDDNDDDENWNRPPDLPALHNTPAPHNAPYAAKNPPTDDPDNHADNHATHQHHATINNSIANYNHPIDNNNHADNYATHNINNNLL